MLTTLNIFFSSKWLRPLWIKVDVNEVPCSLSMRWEQPVLNFAGTLQDHSSRWYVSYIALSFLYFSYRAFVTSIVVSWKWLLPVPISVVHCLIAKTLAQPTQFLGNRFQLSRSCSSLWFTSLWICLKPSYSSSFPHPITVSY